jgi:tol-pal system beta propeller repeat protein TolB
MSKSGIPDMNKSRIKALSLIVPVILLVSALACRSGSSPIVFTSDRDGNLEIYSVRFDGRGDEENLTNSPQDEFSPVLSSNGRNVAFLAGAATDSTLEVMRITGKERTQVFSGGGVITTPKWSPNSQRLSYVLKRESGNTVYVGQSDGSESMVLTTLAADGVGDWSPAGDSVIFAVRETAEQGLYIRNPDGVNEFKRTETPDFAATWSPNSLLIAFLSTRDSNPDIYVMDPEGGDAIRITESEAPEYSVSWSPDSKKLLFVTERDGNSEIYVVEVDESGNPDNLHRLTHNEVRDDQPVWSPNGKKIAFVSYLDGDADIFVMDADGQNQKRLTNNQFEDTQPSW